MEDARLKAEIEGAKAYEALHVPALFEEWAPRVLDAARVGRGQRVLDVACGTGVLARAAAERVGGGGAVIGVDPNPGMLAVARRLSEGIRWEAGVAEDLPTEDGTFDRVGHRNILQWHGAGVRDHIGPGNRFANNEPRA